MVDSFVGSFCESNAWKQYGSLIDELPFLNYTPCFEDAVLMGTVRICLIVCSVRRLQLLSRKVSQQLHLRSIFVHVCKLCLVALLVLIPVLQLGGRLAQGQADFTGNNSASPVQLPAVAPFEVAGFILEFLAWASVSGTLIRELLVYQPDGAWLLRFGFVFAFLTNSIKLWFVYRVINVVQVFYIFFFVAYGAVTLLAVSAVAHHPAVVLSDGSLAPLLASEDNFANSVLDDSQRETLLTTGPSAISKSPEEAAGLFSRLGFRWVTPLLAIGYKRPLEEKDMWTLAARDRSATLTARLDEAWCREQEQHKEKATLQRAVMKAWARPFILSGVWKLLNDGQQFSGPVFMSLLLKTISSMSEGEGGEYAVYKAYGCAFAMFAMQIAGCVGEAQYFQGTMRCGMQVRSAIMHALFAKTLRLSNASRAKFTVGRLNNMMSSDCEAIQSLVNSLHTMWSAPLRIIVAMSLLSWQVGLATITGTVLIIISVPLQKMVMSRMGARMRDSTKATDERVRLASEAFGAVQVVKLYAWEKSFAAATSIAREEELAKILRFAYLRAVSTFLVSAIPIVTSTATFVTFALIYGSDKLTPAVAFTTLSLLGVLQGPLNNLPSIINQVSQALISLERLNEVMQAEELAPWKEPTAIQVGEIDFQNCSFRWNPAAHDSASLSNLNLRLEPGQFAAVVGRTGSGKSSLLAAILGDMPMVQGSLRLSRSAPFAYVPQRAFIFNATVQQNIVFGAAFDKDRYSSSVEAACLSRDFSLMPAGDKTEIGERGVNLSGGQKQRISLARALYHYESAPIFLLDDPLSALDAVVAREVHEKAFLGLLKEKTRVLVTNRVEFVASCNVSVLMSNGAIAASGSYQDMLRSSGEFAELMKEGGAVQEESDVSQKKATPAAKTAEKKPAEPVKALAGDGSLVKAEYRATGAVSSRVMGVYMQALGGCCMVFLIALTFLSVELCRSGASFWLSVWSTHKDQLSVFEAVGVYAAFNTATLLINFLNQLLLARQGLHAGAALHKAMYLNLLHAPMAFFDTTPLGRVINRFTKDVSDVDKNTITFISAFLRSLIQMAASLIIIGSTAYYALFAFAPIFVMLYWVQQYYNASAREVKRLDALTRSPVYQEFGTSLDGMTSIRAYMKQEYTLQRSGISIDRHIKTNLASMSLNRWLALRLETLGGTLVLVVGTFSVAARDVLGSGFAGLALSYALQMTMMTQVITRTWSMAEQALNSVERLDEYAKGVAQEAPAEIEATRPPDYWPSQGRIEYKDVWASYRDGLPPVLKGLTFTVEPGHKVGIVGRTGAGKSSTLLTLFRIVESSTGSITIDGTDIRQLGLFDLRSRLGIIPQDPFIFKGTIRSNLDPFGKHNEVELWDAIRQAHLGTSLQGGENRGLDTFIDEGGTNLSMGQRQLVCLARAVLRGAKILVLDEATASVDVQTDALIQQTIRLAFAQCTMLTIAHRLQTIIDSDRILVMDAGTVKEYDSPANLLSSTDTTFYSMVMETGQANADALISIALGKVAQPRKVLINECASCEQPIFEGVRRMNSSGDFSDSSPLPVNGPTSLAGDDLAENLKVLLERASSTAEELHAASRTTPVSAVALEELRQLQQRLHDVFEKMEHQQITDVSMES